MASLGRGLFLSCQGALPAHLGLTPLTTARPTNEVIRAAFAPFFEVGKAVEFCDDIEHIKELNQSDAPTLVYIMGHAWIEDN
jgi:hypothetical protein